MKVSFCGGAGEVGASCVLLNIDGKNMVFDCGIRMGAGKDVLPDMQTIQENRGADTIFVSHAHLDHSGSLPVVSREYPDARIYMTHATKDLIRVLLYDSLKIMESRDAEIPVFAEVHVRNMLGRILCYSPGYTFKPFNNNICVTFYNAGHVAGAASIYVTGEEGAFFYSGDISVTPQRTVEGASIPRLRPDVAVFESTYGDRLHASRDVEEERFVNKVREIIASNKKILIPAFALGRAQEIILVLKKAINRGELPQTKIYVDGMVNDICRIYKMNPNYLKRQLGKKILKGNDIFYDDNVTAVTGRQKEREEILSRNEGCCIISSSGMLTGGPSQWYAEKLAVEEGNYIAITGYQDEEAPGRQLLELADMSEDEDRVLKIGDRSIPVRCGIGKYGLSAHADRTEILSLVHSLGARRVFFVHGNSDITSAFAAETQKEYRGRIYVPSNGEEYKTDIRNPRKQLKKQKLPSLNKPDMPSEESMEELWEFVLGTAGKDTGLTVEELLFCWSVKRDFSEEDVSDFNNIVNSSKYFEPEMRRPFIFHTIEREKLAETEDDKYMEANQMLALSDEYFPPETGLYKKGAKYEEKTCLLYFNFPVTATEKHKEKIAEFEDKTGWKVQVNSECNLSAAEDLIYRLLPAGTEISQGVSYFRTDNLFRVKVRNGVMKQDLIQNEFKEITGVELSIEVEGENSIPRNTPVLIEKHQVEQNQALKLIDEAFKDKKDKLYKKSIKSENGRPLIELSFISPLVGARYRDLIEELESRTWWEIKINSTPNQNEIIKIGRRLFDENGVSLRKNLSYHPKEMEVTAVVQQDNVDADVVNRIKSEFEEMTGIRINIQ